MKYLVALLAFGISGLVFAQASLPAFEELDANSDGEISMEEAAAVEGLDFATADTDLNGSLNQEEYTAAQSQ